MALDPKFIVCDEPVSALDVSIQAQILNLLMDLQEEHGLAYMFITHNMSVVRHISHNISVMYLGQLVETSPTKELFSEPFHPYTKALLSAIPTTDILSYATENCRKPQKLEEIKPGHFVSCCRVREINSL